MRPTLGRLAFQNPRLVYGMLFQAASQTLLTLAADPRRIGAQIGFPACCTLGINRCALIRTCKAWFPPVASPRVALQLNRGSRKSRSIYDI